MIYNGIAKLKLYKSSEALAYNYTYAQGHENKALEVFIDGQGDTIAPYGFVLQGGVTAALKANATVTVKADTGEALVYPKPGVYLVKGSPDVDVFCITPRYSNKRIRKISDSLTSELELTGNQRAFVVEAPGQSGISEKFGKRAVFVSKTEGKQALPCECRVVVFEVDSSGQT